MLIDPFLKNQTAFEEPIGSYLFFSDFWLLSKEVLSENWVAPRAGQVQPDQTQLNVWFIVYKYKKKT